jgi:hypothetical protein
MYFDFLSRYCALFFIWVSKNAEFGAAEFDSVDKVAKVFT